MVPPEGLRPTASGHRPYRSSITGTGRTTGPANVMVTPPFDVPSDPAEGARSLGLRPLNARMFRQSRQISERTQLVPAGRNQVVPMATELQAGVEYGQEPTSARACIGCVGR